MNLFTWYWLFVVVGSILYAALMLWFMVGWRNLKYYVAKKEQMSTRVCVIVPFFNEQESIVTCLNNILKQDINTQEIELIAVNDHSTDGSEKLVEELCKKNNQLVLLANDGKGKKEAIATAIAFTKCELIITTDADCTFPSKWLRTMVSYFEDHNPGMIIGPVSLNTKKGFFQRFQLLEFHSLIMSTGGAAGIGRPIMCNGANLAFKRSIYNDLDNPLNNQYISGDDVFLMHSIKQETDAEIHFLKSHDALVKTQGQNKLKAFMKQRERWVSKTPGYNDGDTLFTAGIVFGVNVLLAIGIIFLCFNVHYLKPLLFLAVVKFIVDLSFFNASDAFFKHKMPLPYFILFELIYVIYVLWSALLGIIRRDRWKNDNNSEKVKK